MSVSFLAPEFLLLLFVAAALVVWPKRKVSASYRVLRSLVLASVVIALAEPVVERDRGTEHWVFVLDQSSSVVESVRTQAHDALQERLKSLDAHQKHSVIVFGSEAPVRSRSLESRALESNGWVWLDPAPEETGRSPLTRALQRAELAIRQTRAARSQSLATV